MCGCMGTSPKCSFGTARFPNPAVAFSFALLIFGTLVSLAFELSRDYGHDLGPLMSRAYLPKASFGTRVGLQSISGTGTSGESITTHDVVRNTFFSMSEAAKLWDQQVGCAAFRERHAGLIEQYSRGGPDTWPSSPSFQNWSQPACNEMALRHVSIRVARPAWFVPNWLEGFHACPRCGVTCQLSWSAALLDRPEAEVYVEVNRPPPERQRGQPLRVHLSLEPHPWGNRERSADVGVGFSPDRDVQSTYARPRESRQHFLAAEKRQDVLLYRATSNCLASWRNNLTQSILERLPHHSFGACDNNVGGRGRELDFYPHCRFQPGTRGPNVEWQEVSHCVLSHYKFVLAVENTRLPAYVTEKIFMALETGTVPIYFGSRDVADFVPPESYIDGDRFSSADELEDYVKTVHADPVLYMDFFAWRRCGVLGHLARARAMSLDTLPCRLCEKVSSLGGREFDPPA